MLLHLINNKIRKSFILAFLISNSISSRVLLSMEMNLPFAPKFLTTHYQEKIGNSLLNANPEIMTSNLTLKKMRIICNKFNYNWSNFILYLFDIISYEIKDDNKVCDFSKKECGLSIYLIDKSSSILNIFDLPDYISLTLQ